MSGGRRTVAVVCAGIGERGGTELYVRRAIEAMAAAGMRVVLVLPHLAPEDRAFVERYCAVWAVFDTLAGTSRRPVRWLRTIAQTARAARLIAREADLAIFHLHSPGFSGLARRLQGRVWTVLSFHTAGLTCPSGGRYLAGSDRICGARAGPRCLSTNRHEGCIGVNFNGRVPWSYLPDILFFQASIQGTLDSFDRLLMNSDASLLLLRERYRLPPSRVISPPLARQEVAGGDDAMRVRDPFRLMFVGRLERYKGCDDALRALAELPEAYHLHVYGTGPQEDALRASAVALNLEERVVWHGWTPQADVLCAMLQSAVLLVPSKWFEAFGQVGPQAIMAGCGVVAYDSGGIADWCTPEVGSLVSLGDWRALAARTLEWAERIAAGYVVPQSVREKWMQGRFEREYVEYLEGLLGAVDGKR